MVVVVEFNISLFLTSYHMLLLIQYEHSRKSIAGQADDFQQEQKNVVVEAMEAKVVVGRSCCVLIINTHPWYYVMYY